MSVLTNSKEEALNVAFQGRGQSSGVEEEEELTKSIIDEVLRLPGNDTCCDCGATGQCVCVDVWLLNSVCTEQVRPSCFIWSST